MGAGAGHEACWPDEPGSRPTTVHDFDWPHRVVVALSASRASAFYLQARAGKQIVSIALEKLRSAQLAEKIDEILDQLMSADGNPFHVPASAPIELVDNDDLEPCAGVMSLGWDPTTAQLVIEAYPLEEVDEDDETDDTEEVLRVRMPVGTARAFARRTREVVGAGRPICVRDPLPADRLRQAHLHIPSVLMPAPDLVTTEHTLNGRLMTASNATFFGSIGDVAVVYKPIAGEKPLWDFPDGRLAHRPPGAKRSCRSRTTPGGPSPSSMKTTPMLRGMAMFDIPHVCGALAAGLRLILAMGFAV